MKKVVQALLFVILVVSSASVFSYSGFGHVLICEIAYRGVQEETRNTIDALVDAQGEYESFSEACKYADRFPRKHPLSHYANYPRTTQKITSNLCVMDDECIFTGIARELSILTNKENSEALRGEALILLGHWIGDLHQPLHLSFKDDKGGNLIDKSGTCSAGNLHAVWDKCIVEREVAPTFGLREGLGYSETGRVNRAVSRLEKSISDTDRQDFVSGEWFEWANESFQITLHERLGYCVKGREACWYDKNNEALDEGEEVRNIRMSPEYLKLWAPVVEQRIKKAGVRLAFIFETTISQD